VRPVSVDAYAALVAQARVTVQARDEEERAAGGVAMDDLALSEVLRIVQAAIALAATTDDRVALAEGQVMLERAVERLQRNVARVAAQEVAWKHRARQPAKRRRSRGE
jgi:hypothetical protein